MILGNINDITQEKFLADNAKLKAALNYLKKGDFEEAKNGMVMLCDGVKLFVNDITTKPFNADKFEAHKDWLDIHYCVEGEEELYIAPNNEMKVIEPYNAEKDIVFGNNANYTKYVLHKGDYLIVFPEEAHAPGCGNGSKLIKIVVKVKI